jgi:polyhydroxybutyrate depolymerase
MIDTSQFLLPKLGASKAALRVLAVLALACGAFASAAQAFGERELTVSTRDGPRTAIVIPAGDGPKPTVIVLHGATMTADITVRVSGFAEAAARRRFTAIFPQGLMRQWHDLRAGGPDGPDDIAFLTALVRRLIDDRIAAPGHIYLAGISNGGMMSFTAVCKAGDLFSGIGTVIANMPRGIEPCNLPPIPLVMVNGKADPMVPYNGGGVGLWGSRGEVLSVKDTVNLFIRADGCEAYDAQPSPNHAFDETTRVTRRIWSKCNTYTPVMLYEIEGGGHQIAGRKAFLPGILGESNRDFSAAEVIMSAFAHEERQPTDY